MSCVELLTIADRFEITGRGVILAPDFSVPKKGWTGCVEPIVIETPNGELHKTAARFEMTHHNIPSSTDLDKRWRVALVLPDCTKEELPIGSRILVSQEVKDSLLPREREET